MFILVLRGGCDSDFRGWGRFEVWFGCRVTDHRFKQPAFDFLVIANDVNMQPGDAIYQTEVGIDLDDCAVIEGHQIFSVGGLAQVRAAAFISADCACNGLQFNSRCDGRYGYGGRSGGRG